MQSISSTKEMKRQREQFPVDVKIIRGVWFETPAGDLLRIVVMSDNKTARHSAYREYHYGTNAVAVDDVTRILMRSRPLELSQQAIDSFAQGMSEPLDVPQVVLFVQGVQSPIGAKCRLYQATDPDDPTKRMGLLIEQDDHGNLQRVTWYKAWPAAAAFQNVPAMLAFELVTDADGVSTLDPNKIGGWAWYFSTTVGIGLSSGNITA